MTVTEKVIQKLFDGVGFDQHLKINRFTYLKAVLDGGVIVRCLVAREPESPPVIALYPDGKLIFSILLLSKYFRSWRHLQRYITQNYLPTYEVLGYSILSHDYRVYKAKTCPISIYKTRSVVNGQTAASPVELEEFDKFLESQGCIVR